MNRALCYDCVEDPYLRNIILNEGEIIECSVCEEVERRAITVQRLGKIMEPIMRKHFEPGQCVMEFGDEYGEQQEGDPMSFAVQEILGQHFEFEDEIVDAIVGADEYWPSDGGAPYWDDTFMYVHKRTQTGRYFMEWQDTLAELKHSRRFFSPAAKSLFERLFDGIEELQTRNNSRKLSVARLLPMNTSVYRARVCNSRALLKSMWKDPIKEIGPPPAEAARPGRMNAEGVVVLYAARDLKTCLAEMRPALGNEVAIIQMKTTQALRVLDFTRLDDAFTGKTLSYFQPDFADQVERRDFLLRLHSLISQPIVPGHEADYLITQTMAEYLAHVHNKAFDGILFSSVQRKGGVNIVLFPERGILTAEPAQAFRVKYVQETIQLVSTTAISYSHRSLKVYADEDSGPLVIKDFDPSLDYDWE